MLGGSGAQARQRRSPGAPGPEHPPRGRRGLRSWEGEESCCSHPRSDVERFADSVSARRRNARFRQREFLASMSSLQRVRICGRRRADGEMGVPIRIGCDGRAYYANVQLCASVHACPVCAAKIRNRRAQEITAACAAAWAMGMGIEFVTLTMPHDCGDRLAGLLVAVRDAYNATRSGRAADDERDGLGIVGTIKALETTHGRNGWHPHLHVLVFTRKPLSVRQRRVLRNGWHARWADAIERAGYRRPLRKLCDVRQVWSASGVGRYTAKVDDVTVGMEIARSDLKQGQLAEHRSPWRILADLQERGVADDLSLWHEYERAMKGKYALRWSKGLRSLLGVAPAATDESIAAETMGGEPIAVVSAALFPVVMRTRGLALHVLQVAENDGGDAVDELLAKVELAAFGEAIPVGVGPAPPRGDRATRIAEVALAAARMLR